ncbi:MAG: GspE/PulE family protein [Candidatus Nitrospinota bacterium M3_3B_026]
MAVRGKRHLGALLLESGVITRRQLDAALEESRSRGVRLGRAIVSLGLMTEEEVTRFLSSQLGAPFVELDEACPPAELLRRIPESFARRRLLFPLALANGSALVAMADPLDLAAIDEVSARLKADVETVISTESGVLGAIERHYGVLGPAPGGEISRVSERVESYGAVDGNGADGGAPIARVVEAIIRQGARDGASDIHIEPGEDDLRARYRIDGVMFPAPSPPKDLESAIVSRIKILARLDIAESRVPQDGGFKMALDGRRLEFRVSTFPTIHGESVVIRLLNRGDALMSLPETGLRGHARKGFEAALRRRQGVVIVSGPTGAGKTTTLYAALKAVSSQDKTTVTIEDPVEYRLENARQTQVNPRAGLTFARGLRSLLRQDPDIIMVGEIRDAETAGIAVQAAMTGHLVLTSTHTTDAASAVSRMLDLGVEPYQLASTLNGTLAQRLARRVCDECAGRGEGCHKCRRSGYRGRIGLFEFMGATEKIRELIMSGASPDALRGLARGEEGMRTILEDGLEKAREGITTFEEVSRVAPAD